ncbi:unnamed protein product [Clonostachys rosea]|uniref:Uncharacterized protein n=1 Tax=Bionectria ochroleuca TaxID=29856 RepID=A0ABY6U718_BIOOC|nr:unnamed protein product [Clonostachys rosea]
MATESCVPEKKSLFDLHEPRSNIDLKPPRRGSIRCVIVRLAAAATVKPSMAKGLDLMRPTQPIWTSRTIVVHMVTFSAILAIAKTSREEWTQ